QTLFILDQEDRALPGEIGTRRGFLLGCCFLRRAVNRLRLGMDFLLLAMPRQEDRERGALALLGIDIDEATGLLDDAVYRRQPKPGALADFLGREERLEDLVPDVGGDAGRSE